MKKIMVTIAALAFAALPGLAQGNAQTEGIAYFLPKTGHQTCRIGGENYLYSWRTGHVWRKVYEAFQHADAKKTPSIVW